MSLIVNASTITGEEITLDKCLSFNFKKDRYHPSAILSARFHLSPNDWVTVDYTSITATLGGRVILKGYLEKGSITMTAAGYICTIRARAKSALLEQNHIMPGTYYNMTLNKLNSDYINLSGISFQPSTRALNYIVIRDSASMWEATSHICVRNWDCLPYATYDNEIRFGLPTNNHQTTINESRIISASVKADNSTSISSIYMKDTSGNYGAYSSHNTYPQQRGIVRIKHINTDLTWLANITQGLKSKLDFSMRYSRAREISYHGFGGEDIYEPVNMDSSIMGIGDGQFRPHAIRIKGGSRGIVTTLTIYDDYYSGRNT
ncbi:MAG: hypothetical protein GX967_02295 [Clostridiales bacterium]|nr:hypothetical protein [Clostridiales bacterium]